MIKNLSQLKKTLHKGAQFHVLAHGRPECVGEQREVTYANSQGFYSVVPGKPDCRTSLANNGRGSHMWWSKAPFWEFNEGVCTLYSSDQKRSPEYVILSMEVTGEAA